MAHLVILGKYLLINKKKRKALKVEKENEIQFYSNWKYT